ncbi:MAG: cobalt ECF transporter T component CbiQ, partial [Deltaproteobacteria bacterium]
MHHRTIEKLASGTSPVHRLDARVKIILVLAFVVAVSLLPPQPQLVFLAPALLVLVALS